LRQWKGEETAALEAVIERETPVPQLNLTSQIGWYLYRIVINSVMFLFAVRGFYISFSLLISISNSNEMGVVEEQEGFSKQKSLPK
jgi:hypothetical protein